MYLELPRNDGVVLKEVRRGFRFKKYDDTKKKISQFKSVNHNNCDMLVP